MNVFLIILICFIVFILGYWLILLPWHTRWGATKLEAGKVLPGDEIVPTPVTLSTRAITINAPVDKIWPWLMQMGQGRGGLYSYENLENLVGCDIHNANQILPEFQNLRIGEKIRLGPDGYPYYVVAGIMPSYALILGGDQSMPSDLGQSWVFVLEKKESNSTRLLIRSHGSFASTFTNFIIWRVITEPLQFVMERRMLLGIKERAEKLYLQGMG
jgi:hypothetical protein